MSGGNGLFEAIFKLEVVISAVLTLALLILAVTNKKTLLSSESRKNLEGNMVLFRITIALLISPLLIFISSEMLEQFSIMITIRGNISGFEEIAEVLELIGFFMLDLGLLLSLALFLRIRRPVDGHP